MPPLPYPQRRRYRCLIIYMWKIAKQQVENSLFGRNSIESDDFLLYTGQFKREDMSTYMLISNKLTQLKLLPKNIVCVVFMNNLYIFITTYSLDIKTTANHLE